MPKTPPLHVTEDQVRWFRARRGHLAGPGAPDPLAAARDLLGTQAQQEGPALLALSQRTAGRPTAAALRALLVDAPRSLVRTWGQRDTLHLYDAAADWALVTAAQEHWASTGRRGIVPSEEEVAPVREILATAEQPITRSDVMHVVPERLVEDFESRGVTDPQQALRYAAGRLLWRLAHLGDVCSGDKVGNEQSYPSRGRWFPHLRWPDPLPDPLEANRVLVERYLALNGPATPADVAHHFGAKVGVAKRWLGALGDEVVPVRCEGRRGLLALARDADALRAEPPADRAAWPVRLLPLFDTLLMGHKDKSWTVPEADEQRAVWRKFAYVAAVVLDRGRIAATWTHEVRRGALVVTVEPLGGWRQADHLAGVRSEADAVSAHLDLAGAEVRVG